jgi:hypothetical protein
MRFTWLLRAGEQLWQIKAPSPSPGHVRRAGNVYDVEMGQRFSQELIS